MSAVPPFFLNALVTGAENSPKTALAEPTWPYWKIVHVEKGQIQKVKPNVPFTCPASHTNYCPIQSDTDALHHTDRLSTDYLQNHWNLKLFVFFLCFN